jgi:hypothetical protein
MGGGNTDIHGRYPRLTRSGQMARAASGGGNTDIYGRYPRLTRSGQMARAASLHIPRAIKSCPDSDKFYGDYILKVEICVDSRDFIHSNRKKIVQNRYLHTFSSVNREKKTGCLGVKRDF